MLCVILSPFSFYWGFGIFGTYEGSNQGVSSSVLTDAHEQGWSDPIKLTTFWWICAVDAVLYCILAWYCDQVVPGEFGAKQPFYFIFLPSYWCGSSSEPNGSDEDYTKDGTVNKDDFQSVDENALGAPAIQVEGQC